MVDNSWFVWPDHYKPVSHNCDLIEHEKILDEYLHAHGNPELQAQTHQSLILIKLCCSDLYFIALPSTYMCIIYHMTS